MKIYIRRAHLIAAAVRSAPVFKRACRLALGPRSHRPGVLNVIFTTNTELRRINRKFLGHDYNTDVIAFPYSGFYPLPQAGEGKGEGNPPFGDVYVSVTQARIQAKRLGHSLLKELTILVAHGVLHLLGYDDHRPRDRRRMFARQELIARKSIGS